MSVPFAVLTDLESLYAKATKGTWQANANAGCKTIKGDKYGNHRQAQYREIATTHGLADEREDLANAKLIALSRNALPALIAIAKAAAKLKAARDERHERVRRLQALAAEARRTGKSGRVDEQPNVFDIGDVTEEICEALAALEKS